MIGPAREQQNAISTFPLYHSSLSELVNQIQESQGFEIGGAPACHGFVLVCVIGTKALSRRMNALLRHRYVLVEYYHNDSENHHLRIALRPEIKPR
jgi:hypothetical protein